MVETVEQSGKLQRVIGWAIILLAFLTPFIWGAVLGSSDLLHPFEKVGQLLFWLFIISILSYFVAKGSKPIDKSYTFIGSAFILLLISIFISQGEWKHITSEKVIPTDFFNEIDNAQQQIKSANTTARLNTLSDFQSQPKPEVSKPALSEKEEAIELLNLIKPVMDEYAKGSVELNNRFIEANLPSTLLAKNLVSPVGIATSRDIVRKYSELVVERSARVDVFLNKMAKAVNESTVSEINKKKFIAGMDVNKPTLIKQFKEMSDLANDYLMAITKIINIGEENLGVLSVQDGKLTFPNDELLAEYKLLVNEVINKSNEELKIQTEMQKGSNQAIEESKTALGKLK